jgi:hypothetical protein
MDTYIDLAADQSSIEFLREETFAARFGERPVLDHVARGLHDDELEKRFGNAMHPGEAAAQFVRLGEGEGAAARAYFQLRRWIRSRVR